MNDKVKQLDWMVAQAKAGRMNRREFVGRITAQPRVHSVALSAVAVGVLDRELVDQRRGQRIVLTDRHEAQLADC